MWPLYDRSGVEEEAQPLARVAPPPRTQSPPPASDIHVCQAGSCLARGAEAVLTEIEELVNEVGGDCSVRPTGCLGFCNEAPNAVVVERGVRRADPSAVHVRLRSLEASAKVVERATGTKPALEAAGVRFAGLRAARARQQATAAGKWNAALRGLAEQAAERPELRSELSALLKKAGYPEGVGLGAGMPEAIANYSPWTVESATPVTRHSFLLRLVSKNKKRGTPHPRGGGRLVEPNTWHTTLLAPVGANEEGPLPWVERDYTPVSTAREWDQGRCSLLVKVYPDGAATSWLHAAAPARLFLSTPGRTLHVPSLVADARRAFRPASVLLLLAGTGVVALPQLLAHREPSRDLGISTPMRDQLCVPIDVVLSCRDDDALMLPQLAQWCRDADGGAARGVRALTLLLTPPPAASAHAEGAAPPPPPFPAVTSGDAAEAEGLLQGLANARLLRERLSADVVSEALARMPQPCRVVVSGPAAFNTAARGMLAALDLDVEEQVTILSA